MKKKEVEDVAYKAMNFPNPGDPKITVHTNTVAQDEVDSGDNRDSQDVNYCPQCGAKLSR